jgi:GDPmannose 4,6-dehydratase
MISNPDEVYNLAAQSFVGHSWTLAEQTTQVNAMGTLFLLQSIIAHDKSIKFYQASTSEMFGKVVEDPQTESTPFYPRSPYAVSKLYAHWITKNMRESYDIFACTGILFNHESERRGIEFVTRKICDGVARIIKGIDDHIALGNVDSKRDWGYAPEYVKGMWMMLQHDEPGDYVLATGKTYSIRQFLDHAFNYAGITDWEPYVKKDPRYYRPAEVDVLRGDATKAKEVLGWEPNVDLESLVSKMMEKEFERYGLE